MWLAFGLLATLLRLTPAPPQDTNFDINRLFAHIPHDLMHKLKYAKLDFGPDSKKIALVLPSDDDLTHKSEENYKQQHYNNDENTVNHNNIENNLLHVLSHGKYGDIHKFDPDSVNSGLNDEAPHSGYIGNIKQTNNKHDKPQDNLIANNEDDPYTYRIASGTKSDSTNPNAVAYLEHSDESSIAPKEKRAEGTILLQNNDDIESSHPCESEAHGTPETDILTELNGTTQEGNNVMNEQFVVGKDSPPVKAIDFSFRINF